MVHRLCVTVPAAVKVRIEEWIVAADLYQGRIFRPINKGDRIVGKLAPHDLRRTCAKPCRKAGGDLEQIQLLLGHASVQTTERYLGTEQNLTVAVNDVLGLEMD